MTGWSWQWLLVGFAAVLALQCVFAWWFARRMTQLIRPAKRSVAPQRIHLYPGPEVHYEPSDGDDGSSQSER